jgi:hypothetical protein
MGIGVTTQTFVGARCLCLACAQQKLPVAPLAYVVDVPGPGEEVAWKGRLRADLPEYVADQLREVAHRQRRTLVSLLLQMMASYCDGEGHNLFHIRPEDFVADRRKIIRARG